MIELGRYTMLKVGHKSAPKDPKRFVNTPVYGAQGRRNRGIFKGIFPFFVMKSALFCDEKCPFCTS